MSNKKKMLLINKKDLVEQFIPVVKSLKDFQFRRRSHSHERFNDIKNENNNCNNGHTKIFDPSCSLINDVDDFYTSRANLTLRQASKNRYK